jgi:hypothetical protein
MSRNEYYIFRFDKVIGGVGSWLIGLARMSITNMYFPIISTHCLLLLIEIVSFSNGMGIDLNNCHHFIRYVL